MDQPRNAMDIQLDYRGRAFAIDLKSQEFWLVLEKNYQPLGIVMGHCVYSMGSLHHLIINIQSVFHGELKRHLAIARQLALARIQFQADQLGADSIIGSNVKVELTNNNEWLEVSIIGTAVRYVTTPHT
jgi:uncharacterized protein YbjQ (UPF0145 family)